MSKALIDKLNIKNTLSEAEYKTLLDNFCFGNKEESAFLASYAAKKAVEVRKEIYKNEVYIRGLIEISNFCKNDCLYCGIRKSNKSCERYRLSKEDILLCCDEGYSLGFRTFVLQGGEDAYFSDAVLTDIINSIKAKYPDCAITLSLGERSRKSYETLFKAGAARYLLRHETANKTHYEKLHPENMSFENRIRCLNDLKEIGFQTGCGFMVSSPYQTNSDISKDLKFIDEFKPDMCGIGPFIPHKTTPFSSFERGSVELTCFLLSLIRLIHPPVLLPATTALGSIDEFGREKGILSGANVIMPNLSPQSVRAKYEIYDNKLFSGAESAQALIELKERMNNIGYKIVTSRGDVKK